MASIANLTLYNAENIASNDTSDVQSLGQSSGHFICYLKVENYVAGTYNIAIQHSPDKVNWEDVNGAVFAPASANGFENISLAHGEPIYPNVRADVAVAGGDADITVQLWFDPRK